MSDPIPSLNGKNVVLGVTGGIAAYKSAEIVSRLRKLGAKVHVIMTRNGTEFITPLTMETLSSNPVVVDTFDRPERWEVEHVALAKAADLMLVAPATANIMAKMAVGLADDMLSTTILACQCPVLLAPAMNTRMWQHVATRQNVETLRSRGVCFVGPEGGHLACGDEGVGRMSEPVDIVRAACGLLCPRNDFQGLKVMVTAGGTREYLDPVRFLTNESSGKMGFAIAEAARARCAHVTLVRGYTTAPVPDVDQDIRVSSTQDLYDAVTGACGDMDVIIQAAAPADYRFRQTYAQKLKKEQGQDLVLEMQENPDIARKVGELRRPGQTLVGFAAETTDLTGHAREKMARKHLDLMVANDVTRPGAGFNGDTNIATLIWKDGEEELPLQLKREMADRILDRVLEIRK